MIFPSRGCRIISGCCDMRVSTMENNDLKLSNSITWRLAGCKLEMLQSTSYAFEPTPAAPCIILQITVLVNSYMIWVGSADSDLSLADREVIEQQVALNGRLASDWACAMPPLGVSNEQFQSMP